MRDLAQIVRIAGVLLVLYGVLLMTGVFGGSFEPASGWGLASVVAGGLLIVGASVDWTGKGR